MKFKKNNLYSFIVSILISVILLSWLLSHVEKGSLIELFQNIFWPAFLGYLVFMAIGFTFRALRYCWLIGVGKVRLRDMFLVVMVRQVFVDLLPMKIGELSYVVLLSKRFKIPVEVGFSSMMAVFLFDSICLFPVLLVSLMVTGKTGIELFPAQFFVLTSILVAILVWILWKLDSIFGKVAGGLDKVVKKSTRSSPSWLTTLLIKCEKIAEELVELKRRKIYLKVFFISLLIRIFKYLSIFSVLFALIRYQGIALPELSIFKVIIGLAGAEFSSFLPIQGLAGFGTWEAAWAFTFQWMGFSRELAILSGFGTHLATQLTEYIFGGFCLILLWLPWRKNFATQRKTPQILSK